MEAIEVICSPDSDLEIRAIELENGLQAVLVRDKMCQDESSFPAAVSMAVRAGYFFDPPEIPGLSHFLEHMLFSGSKRYPESNDFGRYVGSHGGNYNALTNSDHTIFHFHVQPKREFLRDALKRFSWFFIAPLMDPVCVEQEISIVDSEFHLRKHNHLVRIQELRAHTAKKGHIFNRFARGNKETLSKADLIEHAKKMFEECYFGGAMKLAIIGRQNLDTLERWVRRYFGPIKKGPPKALSIPAFNITDPIWDASISYGLKIQAGHILELLWILPPLSDNFYLERPELYLVRLLEQPGKGSLSAFFKKEGWTISFSVKVPFSGSYCTSVGRQFIISMNLTLSGLEKRYELISYTYQYLKLLGDTEPQRWVMDEFWKIKKREYDNDVNTFPPDFSVVLSGNMLRYPLTHVLLADYLSNWNPDAIVDLLKYFTPERMRIDFASESINDTELKNEPWCNSFYLEEQIPPGFKEAWSSPSGLHPSLFFPSQNKYLPTSFELRDHPHMDLPECIVNTSSLKLWYIWKDVRTSYFFFCIYHKGGHSSVKKQLMMTLFTLLLKDELHDILYQSKTAGLSASIELHDDQLSLKGIGYREKLNLLVSDIWTSFMNFSPTTERFEVIKERIKTILNRLSILGLSKYMLDQILSGMPYSICEQLQVLNEISFAELERFIRAIRSKIFIEGLCAGDLLPAEAKEISNVFQVQPLPKEDRHKNRIKLLRTKLRRINVKVSDSNSLIKLYFQIGREKGESMRTRAMILLFGDFIKERLFSKLRKEEQLGYTVECSDHLTTCGVHGFIIYVISIKHNPTYLLKRVCKFVDLIGGRLENVSDESFEDYKEGVISKLKDHIDATWDQIVSKRYKFDSYSEEVAELRRIKKKDLIKWYMKYFRSAGCRRIALGLWGSKTNMKRNGLHTKKKRNGLRLVKIHKLLKLSSTRLPQKTFKKVRKLVINRESTT